MNAQTMVDRIRQQVAAHDESLQETRRRRDYTRQAAAGFPGALRTYSAGSLATYFTNHPVSDADAGVVMDRRALPNLGPDGKGELPAELVDAIGRHIRPPLAALYPYVRVERMKRGLLISFGQPLATGEDPTVDLVVALNRAQDDALWIPNLDENRWDPSHPEKHVELFTAGAEGLRRTRRHVVRLAKAQVQQFDDPHICSFNIAALAWECIQSAERIDLALWRFFDYAATELAKHLTEDPAGVSSPIRVEDRRSAVARIARTAHGLRLAIDARDDEDKVRAALAARGVFWRYVSPPMGSGTHDVLEAVLSGSALTITSAGVLVAGTAPRHQAVKPTRAHGGHRA